MSHAARTPPIASIAVADCRWSLRETLPNHVMATRLHPIRLLEARMDFVGWNGWSRAASTTDSEHHPGHLAGVRILTQQLMDGSRDIAADTIGGKGLPDILVLAIVVPVTHDGVIPRSRLVPFRGYKVRRSLEPLDENRALPRAHRTVRHSRGNVKGGVLGQLLFAFGVADAEIALQQKDFLIARVVALLLLPPAHRQRDHQRDGAYAGGAAEQPRFHPLRHARNIQVLPRHRLGVLDEDIAGTALTFITAGLRRRRRRGLLGR